MCTLDRLELLSVERTQKEALDASRAACEAQMPKKVELMTEQKQAKVRVNAAKQEAKRAANALAEGERKLSVRRSTLEELMARMANSEEVRMLLFNWQFLQT